MFSNCDSLPYCPRLIDYLVFVGREGHSHSEEVYNQIPSILKCYPLLKHKDFVLPNDVVYFCQPEGCLSSNLSSTNMGTTTFVFTLTDKDSQKTRFGICLNFFRQCSVFDPVCSNEDSKSKWDSNSTLVDAPKDQILRNDNKQSILTSLCLISHHPFFSKFRQCLHSLKEIIDRCDEYFKQLYSANSQSYSFWSTILSSQPAGQINVDHLLIQVVYEIESWIINLLNAPVPIPGKTCLHLTVGPESFYEKLIFALPDKTRLTLIDFPLHLPLELLGMETCLKVLSAIMLEQKVVLQSRDYNALTMSVMALTAMLYPLQYMFPAIPLLPNSLKGGENLLLSPTPFLIGIPATFLSQKTDFRFPADVWLVDLDANKMMGSSLLEPIPLLPEKEGKILCENLDQALSSMTANLTSSESTEINLKNSAIQLRNADSADVATRVAMVRFFNSLNVLGNITEHTRTIRLFPRPVVAFQKFSFLKSRQVLTPFTRKLAETQAVEFFAEWCLYPENEVFQRIHAGIHDPEQIGDKGIWYQDNLAQINFQIWSSEQTDRYLALNFIHSVIANSNDIKNFEMVHENFPKFNTTTNNNIMYDLMSLYNPPHNMDDLLKNAIQPQQYMRKNKPKRRPNQQQLQPMDSFDLANAQMQKSNSTENNEIELNKKKLPGQLLTIPSMAESTSDSSDDQDDSDIWDLKDSVSQSNIKENPNEVTHKDNMIRDKTNNTNHVQNTENKLILTNTPNVPILRKPSLRKVPTTQQTNYTSTEMNKRSVHYNEEQLVQVLNKDSISSGDKIDQDEDADGDEDEEAAAEVEEEMEDDEDDTEQTSVGKYLLNNLSDNLADAASHASTTLSGLLNKPKTIVRKSGSLMKKMATEITSTTKTTDTAGNKSSSINKHLDVNSNKPDGDLIHSASKFVLNFPKQQFFQFGANKSRQQEAGLFNKNKNDKLSSGKGVDSNFLNPEQSYADQEFLREVVRYIHEGQANVQTKFSVSRLKELLHDENYRNYLLSKLNRGLSTLFDDPDDCIPDVSIININGYKSHIWLLQCVIHGLEQTCTNHGIGGLASAMMLLELCHTHYLNTSTAVSPSKLHGSQNSTNQNLQEDENLVSAFTGWLRTTTKDLKKVTKPNIVTGLFSRPNPSENLNNNNNENQSIDLTIKKIDLHQTDNNNSKSSLTVGLNDSDNINRGTIFGKKSQHASSYRFIHGNLIDPSAQNQLTTTHTGNYSSKSDNRKISNSDHSLDRVYLYEYLIDGHERSRLWDHMQFWEDTFFDTVAQERDILGLDQAPTEMLEQFANMNTTQKRIVILKEDRLLAFCLYNLTAYMILMNVDKSILVTHVRRLLARCRIGSYFAAITSHLLDNVKYLDGNSIDLLPSMTRLKVFQSYEIELLNNVSNEAKILEIYGKCLTFRNLLGEIVKKLDYDQLIDLSFEESIISLKFIEQETNCDQFSLLQIRCDKAKQICHTIETLIQRSDLENSQQ
ncbi:unnamed protein product [Schistosoma bovis]|nr:unnamed protein product [Schistosoma bovis]